MFNSKWIAFWSSDVAMDDFRFIFPLLYLVLVLCYLVIAVFIVVEEK